MFGFLGRLTLFMSCCLIVACKQQAPQTQSSLGYAKRGEFFQRVTIAGMVVPNRKTLIATPYNGYVKKLFVKVGDEILQGDPVVSISQSLQSTDTVYPLRAPFAGTVVHIEKSEGEYVKEGEVKDFIVRIDDLSKYYVISYAPEIDRAKLKKGQEAIVKISAIMNRVYKGVIRDLSMSSREREVKSTQVEFPVKVEIIDPDDKIRPGMSAVLDIIVQRKKNALMLRQEYVRNEDDRYFVVLQNGETRDVEIGLQNEEVFEITKGLEPTEAVRMIDFTAIGGGSD